MEKLQLSLPVMLHSDTEPQIFLDAKVRLEEMGQRYGVPVEVGAFLPYMPAKSRTPEAFQKQVDNQRKYGLPIRLVETGIQRNNSLAYVPSDPTYNSSNSSQLDVVIDQVARLRDLDPNPQANLVVAPHVGPLVVDIPKGDFTKPGIYSPQDFAHLRDQIYAAAKERFQELQTRAKSKGLVLAIENAYPMAWENASFWQTGQREGAFGPTYQVFNDLQSLLDISGSNIVFDLAHLVSVQDLPNQFARSPSHNPSTLFETMGVSGWEQFAAHIGKLEDYLPFTRALHISQVDGVGVRVPKDSPDAKVWGGAGILPLLISDESHADLLRRARKNGLCANIEQDYGFKSLTFKEADAFIEPVLQELAK